MHNLEEVIEGHSRPARRKAWPSKSIHKSHALSQPHQNFKKSRYYTKNIRSVLRLLRRPIKAVRRYLAFFGRLATKLWIPVISLLWVCYIAGNFVEFLSYFIIFLILKALDYVHNFIIRVYRRIFYSINLRRKNSTVLLNGITPTVSYQADFTIVLDLDETLVHTTEEPPSILDYDYFTISDADGETYYVYKRPYLDDFLKELARLGKVVIFTASEKHYAIQVIRNLDQENIISAAYFRDSCSVQTDRYVKKLKNLGYDLKRTVVVDDTPGSYKENVENAIPISGWNQHLKEDSQLWEVLEKIKRVQGCKDVRKTLTKLMNGHKITLS